MYSNAQAADSSPSDKGISTKALRNCNNAYVKPVEVCGCGLWLWFPAERIKTLERPSQALALVSLYPQ